MRRAYSVFTPPFDPTSGGIRVMYGLYGWLLAKGEIVFLNGRFDTPDYGVAIYPEITNGNPLNASTAVRYILQTPGMMSGYGVPSPTTEQYKTDPQYAKDHFYMFSKIYDTIGVDDPHIMFLPIINLQVFKDTHQVRTKTCYLVGKGINQNKHPKDSIELTREFAQDQQALSNLLNECHTLYCYDRLSAMMEVARLCGCRVEYWGGLPQDQLELYEPGTNGITYEDGYYNELNTVNFRYHYIRMREEFSKRLDKFIEETQK